LPIGNASSGNDDRLTVTVGKSKKVNRAIMRTNINRLKNKLTLMITKIRQRHIADLKNNVIIFIKHPSTSETELENA
jgi:hypothetical protein